MPSLDDMIAGGGGGSSKSSRSSALDSSQSAGLDDMISGSKSKAKGSSSGGKKKNWLERILGSKEDGRIIAKSHAVGPQGVVNALTLAARPLEAVQGAFGATNLRTGAKDGALTAFRKAMLEGEQYGISGDGAGNTAANLGLDLIDPTILFSAGSKAAKMGSRALVEGGAKDLATKAATKGGLDAAEQAAARTVISEQIAAGGAGDLAKRSLLDKATHRFPGLAGEELATERALTGLVKEGQGGIRLAGRTVLSGETMRKGGDIARKVPAIGIADETAKSLFIPRSGVTKALGRDTSAILYNAQARATGQLDSHVGEIVRPVQKEAKANKITQADREGPLLSALERGTPVEPRLQGALDGAKKIRDDATAMIVDRKLLPEEHLHAPESYVPRQPTEAGFAVMAAAKRRGAMPAELSRVFKVAGSVEARKILPTATIPEAEAVVQKMLTDAGTPMPAGKKFFEHDPMKALVSHSAAVQKASGQLGVLETLAGVPGLDIVRLADSSTVKAPRLAEDIAKARTKLQTSRRNLARAESGLAAGGPAKAARAKELGHRQLAHSASVKSAQQNLADLLAKDKAAGAANAAADAARKAPEGYEAIKIGEQTAYVHPELASELNKTKRLVDSPEAVQRTVKHIDAVQNWWRASVTVLPIGTGYFGRNGQGNLIFNLIDNVGLRDYKASLSIQLGVKKARKAGVPVESVLTPEQARIFKAAEGRNVYNQGAQEADLEHVFPGEQVSPARQRMSPLTGKINTRDLPILGTERGPIQLGRTMNSALENNARLANYIAGVRRTGSFDEAALRTRTTMLDYGDLTPFEQQVGRRMMGFYTFAKKSTEQLLRELAHDPAKINRITNSVEAVEDATGRNIDSPWEAGSKQITDLATNPAEYAKSNLGAGGYLGAAKGQMFGTILPDKQSGGSKTIDPGSGSESRRDMAVTSFVPIAGKYGRIERALRQARPGEDQDLLRLLLGLSPKEMAAYRDSHKAR